MLVSKPDPTISLKFLNKKYIKEMQYVSLTTTIKLNNVRIMFYHIN